MFLLEAPVSCVASPFVSVARLGPDQRPQSRTPAPPTAQEYYYHAGSGLWQTAVTLGMTRTRLSDLCVWPALPQQQVAFPSTSLDQSNVECVCPAKSAMPKNFNTSGQGVFGYSGSTFQAVMDGPLKPHFHGNRLWHLKSLDTENQQKVKCLTRGHRARAEKHTHKHTHTPFSQYLAC